MLFLVKRNRCTQVARTLQNEMKLDTIRNARRDRLKWPVSVKAALSSCLPPYLFRASAIKLKINGRCVNRCSFCKFHDDPNLLEVQEIASFFEMLDGHRYRGVIVNGGEPTIHPRFLEICDYLADRFQGKVHLALGTNLIPLVRSSERYRTIYRKVLSTFDHIEVGCDDEHHNIDILEKLAPHIVDHGLTMMVNVVTDYCSPETFQRIEVLTRRLGIILAQSDVHHFYAGRPITHAMPTPCRHRFHNLAIECNGNAFFCYHQEFEQPLFNLFHVTKIELDHYLAHHDPGIFKYCPVCRIYEPETIIQRLAKPFFSFSQCR